MRFSKDVLYSLLLTGSATTTAFQTVIPRRSTPLVLTRHRATTNPQQGSLHEFDYLLRETNEVVSAPHSAHISRRGSQVAIRAGDSDQVRLISSGDAALSADEAMAQYEYEDQQLFENDMQVDELYSGSQRTSIQYQDNRAGGLQAKLEGMDFQDIVLTLVVPSIIVFASGRWVFNRVVTKVSNKLDTLLESFVEEMIYHDGDFSEMQLCMSAYSKKLLLLGPKKRDKMAKRYLEKYVKRVAISPQSISSLSYAFSLFKLDEESAANLLASLSRQLGSDRGSSVGKIYFLGNRILKSAEGKKALQPIRKVLKLAYGDSKSGDTMIDIAQR